MTPAGRRLPVELIVAPLLAVALAVALVLEQRWLSILFGIVQIVLVPGYLILWAIFPQRSTDAPERGITPLERAAFAVPISFGVVAVLGLILDAMGDGLTRLGIAVALLLTDAIAFAIALVRFYGLPVERRWSLATLSWPAGPGPLVLGACTVLAALSMLWFAADPPQHDEPFTAVALVGPQDAASCYPTIYEDGTYLAATRMNGTLDVLEDCPAMDTITVLVQNEEGHSVDYFLVVSWADPAAGRDVVRSVLLRTSETVADGKQWTTEVTLGAPAGTGPGFLYFQVFMDAAPTATSGPLPTAHEEVRLAIERGDA